MMAVQDGAYCASSASSQVWNAPSNTSNHSSFSSSQKRKTPPVVIDLTQSTPPKKRRSKAPAKDSPDSDTPAKPTSSEKRLRRWRNHPPSSYLDIRARALTQRMYILDRQRSTSAEAPNDHPTETITLAGTTGNVYTITISKIPSCNCPHAEKGHQCKHLVYILSRVLRVRAELEYQLAFTSSELREIFEKAPPLPSQTAVADRGPANGEDGRRKAVEGECPICCVDFEPAGREEIVWCRAACGNNIHAGCFAQWAATKRGGKVTCPFCRMPWQDGEAGGGGGGEMAAKKAVQAGRKNAEGYVNVAAQLGLSGRRDYSTYHSFWVMRQARSGDIEWDEDGVMMHDR